MDKIKRAHILRAREQYNDEMKETPGSFEEFFGGQYKDEYINDNPKKDKNEEVIDRYKQNLANTREGDREEQPGLLGKIQTMDKGPYPANAEEDEGLLEQMMKFTHSEQMRRDIVKQLKEAPNTIVKEISMISANIAARLLLEMRKRRKVTEEAEKTVIAITAQDLWTIARNLGLKQISREMVTNSINIAQNTFDNIEKQAKTRQIEQPQEVQQLNGGRPAPQQEVQ